MSRLASTPGTNETLARANVLASSMPLGRPMSAARSCMIATALTMIVIVTAICTAIRMNPPLFLSIARQMGPSSMFLSY